MITREDIRYVLHVLAAILLVVGLAGAVYMIVAVATKTEGLSTLPELIPALVFHAVAMFLGMVCFGIARKIEKPSEE